MIFPEKGGSENADKIWTLYLLIFILAWIVFIGVAGALLWAMIGATVLLLLYFGSIEGVPRAIPW